jgi:hypothetical protein
LGVVSSVRVIAVAALSLTALACGKENPVEPTDGPIACTAIAVAGVDVKVLDAATGLPLAFRNLWARVRDGAYTDSAMVAATFATSAPFHFGLAYERPGTYDLTVQATGYKAFYVGTVTVKSDICHVTPVSVTAYLQK